MQLFVESAKGNKPQESTSMQQNPHGNLLEKSAKSNLLQESNIRNKTPKSTY